MQNLIKMRLILDMAHSATFNMAADEFLTGQQSRSDQLPTLRIYFWNAPSISIGYFQDVAKTARRFQTGGKKPTVVKRITGGGLVQHGSDLTFSLILKKNNPFLPSDVKMSYLKVNEALRLAGAERQDSVRGALDVLAGARLDDRADAWR